MAAGGLFAQAVTDVAATGSSTWWHCGCAYGVGTPKIRRGCGFHDFSVKHFDTTAFAATDAVIQKGVHEKMDASYLQRMSEDVPVLQSQ